MNEQGKKFDQGKLRLDLVPPEVDIYLAPIYEYGVNKYGYENWKGNLHKDRILAALLRHIAAYRQGEKIDPESGFHHLQHALWNCFTLLWYEIKGEQNAGDKSS